MEPSRDVILIWYYHTKTCSTKAFPTLLRHPRQPELLTELLLMQDSDQMAVFFSSPTIQFWRVCARWFPVLGGQEWNLMWSFLLLLTIHLEVWRAMLFLLTTVVKGGCLRYRSLELVWPFSSDLSNQ